MSFIATAVVGGAIAYREVRKGRKQAAQIAAEAKAAQEAETAAIKEQSAIMRRKAVKPPPPPPSSPVVAPIRQAAPGTGTSVIAPSMLVRAMGKKRQTQTSIGGGLGYGSRLG